MASLHLESVPEDLVKRLELAADARHRALVSKVIERLDDSFGGSRVVTQRDHAELLRLARRVRGEGDGAWLTPEFIRMTREYGRA